MEKAITVIPVEGELTVLHVIPTFDDMRNIILGNGLAEDQPRPKGLLEHVLVLDAIEADGWRYTSMYVDEEGLLKGKPRNERATEIYQRNVRSQWPDVVNPFEVAEAEMKRRAEEMGMVYIKGPDIVEGYSLDPFIAGTAIVFHGYTRDEVDDLFNKEDDNEEENTNG